MLSRVACNYAVKLVEERERERERKKMGCPSLSCRIQPWSSNLLHHRHHHSPFTRSLNGGKTQQGVAGTTRLSASLRPPRTLLASPFSACCLPLPTSEPMSELVPVLERGGRLHEGFQEELAKLLGFLPERISGALHAHPELEELVEIVLDLGRPPTARFPSGDSILSNQVVTAVEIDSVVSLVGDFSDDNRAGIDRTLHRVSAIRNREGRIIGLTCRVGRAISGSAEMVRDIVCSGGSLLLMGPPGVGKTTAIREISRMLADEYHRRVVIVDTSNEIAGDGDIPHQGIGHARRMQVPNVDKQHETMIEAVENHMPEIIVIDEIGTELEVLAAGTISQRGVQLVGTAHGITVENIIKNPSLQMLAGGIQSVTLGDDEARRRGVQKSVLERKGPPTFTAAAEMLSRMEWRIHSSLALTVDALLAGRIPQSEVRRMDGNGNIVIAKSPEAGHPSLDQKSLYTSESDAGSDEEENDDFDNDLIDEGEQFRSPWQQGDGLLFLFAYQISEDSLEQVIEVLGLESAVQLTNDIGEANAVLALRSKLKQNSWLRGMAKFRQIPVFVVKANTMPQMVRAVRTILGMETLGTSGLVPWTKIQDQGKVKNEDNSRPSTNRKATLEDEVDALEEARLAIEQIVIPKGQPVELFPRSLEIVSLQMKLAETYQLQCEKAGTDSNVCLRILPLHIENNGIVTSDSDSDAEDLSSECTSGTSVSRLPLLPE